MSISLQEIQSGLEQTEDTASSPHMAEDNKLSLKSLEELEEKLKKRNLEPLIITGHTGWTRDRDWAFKHRDKKCAPFSRRAPDPEAPYDGYDESDDTEENTRNSGYLKAKH